LPWWYLLLSLSKLGWCLQPQYKAARATREDGLLIRVVPFAQSCEGIFDRGIVVVIFWYVIHEQGKHSIISLPLAGWRISYYPEAWVLDCHKIGSFDRPFKFGILHLTRNLNLSVMPGPTWIPLYGGIWGIWDILVSLSPTGFSNSHVRWAKCACNLYLCKCKFLQEWYAPSCLEYSFSKIKLVLVCIWIKINCSHVSTYNFP
jgi:hypothetical protein